MLTCARHSNKQWRREWCLWWMPRHSTPTPSLCFRSETLIPSLIQGIGQCQLPSESLLGSSLDSGRAARPSQAFFEERRGCPQWGDTGVLKSGFFVVQKGCSEVASQLPSSVWDLPMPWLRWFLRWTSPSTRPCFPATFPLICARADLRFGVQKWLFLSLSKRVVSEYPYGE